MIVGSGTGGFTLAARLTEDPAVTVAVLEAGANCLNDSTILTPALTIATLGDQTKRMIGGHTAQWLGPVFHTLP
jgi:choline dehydrogenase-like flavoprotein